MRFPNPAIARFIRINSRPTTVYRRDDTTDNSYGSSITYSELAEARDMVVTGIEESRQPTDAGENQATSLVAYATPNVDLEVNDRIDHGTEQYEIETAVGIPNDDNPAAIRYELGDI